MKSTPLFLCSIVLMPICLISGCVPRTMKSMSSLGENIPYREDPHDADVMIYHNPKRKVTSYSKFLIDPVKIISNESQAIKPEEEAVLADSFRRELIAALQDGYPIVTEPGPGILRIRTAIQDIQPAHMELDEDRFVVLRLDTALARVAMELECADSVSGERIAALIHTLHDRRYFGREKTTRLLNVKESFAVWTRSLRKRFDETKARPGAPSGGTP